MNANMEHIICLYFSGETTPEDEKFLFEWINLSKENEQLFFEQMALWSMKTELKDYNIQALNHSLSRLNARIDQEERRKKHKTFLKRTIWSSIAAAILVAIVLMTTQLSKESFSPPLITYSNTMEDSIMTITLDDETTVWLNSNSSLTIASGFLESKRKVNLSGCAFFEVAKDTLRPFIVSSDEFQIRVLGTSFGVSTDYAENISETVLLEGAIQLENHQGNKLATLSPGQQALITKNSNRIEIKNVDARKLALWRFGIISLQNVSISEIITNLEEIYQVKIYMNDMDQFKTKRYNFSFLKNKNPEEALRYLNLLTGKEAKLIF